MQRGRGGMDDFFGFGDPFAGFGGFGISSFFGGRDPFDDPFFTQPFGGMMGPSIFGRSMFGAGGSPFGHPVHAGFLQNEAPQPSKSKGPIIEELASDDETAEQGEGGLEKKDKSRKHSRSSKEPYVQEPDEETEEKRSKHMQQMAEFRRPSTSQLQNRSYTFHSSTVTCGGPNGAYYSSSTTRRTGGNGVTVEESREADTTTRKASHRISRGIHDKGHSVTRKLGSDGRVDTMQTIHNLNEDEVAGFEEAWKGNAKRHLPGWEHALEMHTGGIRGDASVQTGQSSTHWSLPAPEQLEHAGARPPRVNFPPRRQEHAGARPPRGNFPPRRH